MGLLIPAIFDHWCVEPLSQHSWCCCAAIWKRIK